MSDQRRHRGPHPADQALFAPGQWPRLQAAVHDVSWLWTRAYSVTATIKLVGDRYALRARQRLAVARASSSDAARDRRMRHRRAAKELAGQRLELDGLNVLTTVEAALSGGVLLECRDETVRDMASVHGSYRLVEETPAAIEAIGEYLEKLKVDSVDWWLDAPVSNTGKLKTCLLRHAEKRGWHWNVKLDHNVDARLRTTPQIVCSADSVILDHCTQWYSLAREVVDRLPGDRWRVPLSDST